MTLLVVALTRQIVERDGVQLDGRLSVYVAVRRVAVASAQWSNLEKRY